MGEELLTPEDYQKMKREYAFKCLAPNRTARRRMRQKKKARMRLAR
jgi:hypothetical protein